MSETVLLLLASATVFVAAFVQGVTGFGHALVAIGVLALLMGSGDAILVLTLVAPVIAVAYYLRVRRHVDWRQTLAISLPLCLIGLPLGIWLFLVIEADWLTRAVGVVLVASAAYFLSPWSPKPGRPPLAVAVGAGSVAGFLAGLTSTGGPPIVLYLHAREMAKDVRMGSLQAIFVISSIVKVLQMAFTTDRFTGEIWIRSAVLSVPIVAGVLLGHALFRRIPAEAVRRITLGFLLIVGAYLTITG